jgi:hypothetical protein
MFATLFQEGHSSEMTKNAQFACTVPTQPKTSYLSLDKSVVSKNQLTRSG